MKDRLTCEYCKYSSYHHQVRTCELVVLQDNWHPKVRMTGGRSSRCPLDIMANPSVEVKQRAVDMYTAPKSNTGGKCLFNSSVKAKREPHLPVGKTTRLPIYKEVIWIK